MYEILVTIPTQPRHREMLEKIAPEAHFAYEMKPAETSVENADIILGNVPPAMLKNAPKLRWIQLNTAGTDGYPEVLREGCLLRLFGKKHDQGGYFSLLWWCAEKH